MKDVSDFWPLFLTNLGVPRDAKLISRLEQMRSGHFTTFSKLYDGVHTVLSTLRKKYKLALVSNCPVGLREVVEALQLDRFFDAVVLSYEARARKPDRRMYLEALQALKLKPEECVFVADEITDLEGAHELGLKTILVRQGERTPRASKDPNFKPNYECVRISETLRFLQMLLRNVVSQARLFCT